MADSVAEMEAPLSAQEAEESFWCLLQGLEILRGFGLYFAKCDSEDVRREVTRRAELILAARGTRLVSVDLANRIDVFDALAEARGEGPVVVFAHSMERPESGADLLRRALTGMNLQRERFRDELRCPVVLWVYADTLALLAVAAPDFHDWRSGIYRFPPHPVEGTIAPEVALQLTMSGRGLDIARAEAVARLEGLRDLLTDLRAAEPTPGNVGALMDVGARMVALSVSAARYTEAVELANDLWARVQPLGQPLLAARVAVGAGLAYADLPTGDRSANLRRAIAYYEEAARAYSEAGRREDWARTQNNLGNAYRDLPTGDRGANLARAIKCYEAALEVFAEDGIPLRLAQTEANLGLTYIHLPTGDRAKNLEAAIAYCQAALQVLTEDDHPEFWAKTVNNLGLAFWQRRLGERGANLGWARECFEAALRVWTEPRFPRDWATATSNIGIVLAELPTGDRAQNLKQAIERYEAALRVRTRTDYPSDWAMTQANLATAYEALPTGDRRANVQQAIHHYEAALSVWTRDAYPDYWQLQAEDLAMLYEEVGRTEEAAVLRARLAPVQWAGSAKVASH
jgi:tetratricopeptide (TPR) repeat protein